MAGIGDSWGTREELLHPRDSHGRFRSKWKMSESVLNAVLKVTSAFHPRTFQSDQQATQYTQNLAHRNPGRFQGGKGYARLQSDFFNANEDLLDGNPDEPSTKKFVQMMDQSMIDLPDDAILSTVVPPAAFGLTPDRLPELEELTGNVVANRGYLAANMGTPLGGGNGNITMSIATPKGTKMAVPGRSPGDRAMYYNRDQELTISKVKPDGRGGYYVWAVATPSTPGENPLPETGHAGPGKPENREADIKALADVATKREMGEQPPGALPGGVSAGETPAAPPAGVPASPGAPAGEDEASRAARRAQVLGRPAGPNATPQTQQEAAQPQAPAAPSAPAAAAPPAPAAGGAGPERLAPAVAEPNVPEAPSGATSVVTGEPATSFRDAVSAANLESPSAGPRRREWNNAYTGIASGKAHPADMLRELEADIATNKAEQKTEGGHADVHLAADIEKQEKLADLIRKHFSLGEPKQREGREAVRADLKTKAKAAVAERTRPSGGSDKRPDEKTAVEAARSGPLAKVAPKRKDGTPESRAEALGTQAAKDAEDDKLNAEQRQQWSDELGGEPKGLTHGDVLLDEVADLLRNGRTTKPKAAARLRESVAGDNDAQADYLNKVADAIENDEEPLPKRVPLKKAGPRKPRAAANVEAAEAALAGKTEKNVGAAIRKHSVADLRALAEKWGVETRDGKKLKLKAALADDLEKHWKNTPSVQRAAEKVEGGDELDSMTVQQLKDYAKANGIKITGALRKDAMRDAIKKQRDGKNAPAAPVAEAKAKAPAEPEVKFPGRLRGLPGAKPRTADQEELARGEAALAKTRKTLAAMPGGNPAAIKTESPEIAAGEAALARTRKVLDGLGTPKTPAAKALAKVAEVPEAPPVVQKAAVKAAKAADREQEIASFRTAREAHLSNPEKKTVSTARLQVGEKLQVQQDSEGNWSSSPRKTGAKTLTVTKIDREPGGYRISGTDEDGNPITLQKTAGQNVVHRAGTAAVKRPPKKMQPGQLTNDELAEASARVLAGEDPGDVGNEITGRRGEPPLPAPELPSKIPTDPAERAREATTLKDLKLVAEEEGLPIKGRPTKEALRAQILEQLGQRGDTGAPAAPATPKIPGVDTAEKERIRARAREVLAEMQGKPAADPFDQIADMLGGNENAKGLAARAKETRAHIQETEGPSGISIEDRVAARMLADLKPEVRESILAEMSDSDRKEVLDAADRVAQEAARVKKSGHDLDRILKDTGFKVPPGSQAAIYHQVRDDLANNKVDRAKAALRRDIEGSDANLRSFREGVATSGQSQANIESLGRRITEELARNDWSRGVLGVLEGGSAATPELATKKEIKQIQVSDPQLTKLSADDIKGAAKAAGIKLPEAATTRDEVFTELTREMIRREKAGNPVDLTPPVPVKKVAKPKAPQERIDARTLLPDQAFNDSEGPQSDKRMLDRVQQALDGEPVAGMPKNASPATIGRWLDSWARGAGGPGYAAATHTITLDGAKRRVEEGEKMGLPDSEMSVRRQALAEAEADHAALRAQGDRWRALAEKLKGTRRTPAKKATAAAVSDVRAELPSSVSAEQDRMNRNMAVLSRGGFRNEPEPEVAPVKKVLARAAKAAPAKKAAPPLEVDYTDPALLEHEHPQEITEALKHGDSEQDLINSYVEDGLSRDMATLLVTETVRALKAQGKMPKKTVPAKKAATAPSAPPVMNAESKVLTEARAEKKAADERFRRLEAKVADLDPEMDRDDVAQLEDDLETARNERDAADDNVMAARRAAQKKAAPPVAKQVEQRAARKEVQAEVAKTTSGGKYTEAALNDMSLAQIKDIEDDLGIKRTSVAKDDRVAAILRHQREE